MANNTEKDYVIWGWQIDEASHQMVIAKSQQVEQVTDAVRQSLIELDSTAKSSNGVTQGFDQVALASPKLRSVTADIEALRNAVLSYAEGADQAAAAGTKLADVKPPSGGGVSGLGSARNFVGQAGGLLSVAGVGSAGSALNSVLSLSQSFGPAGIAAGVFTLALKGVTEHEQKAADAGKQYIAVLQDFTQQIASGTTSEDIQKTIDNLTTQRAVEIDALKGLEGYREQLTALSKDWEHGSITEADYRTRLTDINAAIFDATKGTVGWKDGIGEVIGTLPGLMQPLNTAIDQAQEPIDKLTGAIAFWQAAMGSGAVAANNAAAAAQQESDALIRNEGIRQQAEMITSAERQKHVAELDREIAGYQDLVDSGLLTADSTEQLKNKISELRDEQDTYRYVVISFADVLAAATAKTDAANAWVEALKNVGDTQSAIFKAEQEEAEATEKHQKAVAKIKSDAQDDIDKADVTREHDRTEAQTKHDKDTLDALKAHLQRLTEINRQYETDATKAIADRDAAALDQAKIAQKNATDTEDEQYQERLRQLDDALGEQFRLIDERYNQEKDRIQKAMQSALDQENERWNEEEAQRKLAYDQLKTDLANFLAQEKALRDAYYAEMIKQAEALQTPVANPTPGTGTWIGPVIGDGNGLVTPPGLIETPGDWSIFSGGAGVLGQQIANMDAGDRVLSRSRRIAGLADQPLRLLPSPGYQPISQGRSTTTIHNNSMNATVNYMPGMTRQDMLDEFDAILDEMGVPA